VAEPRALGADIVGGASAQATLREVRRIIAALSELEERELQRSIAVDLKGDRTVNVRNIRVMMQRPEHLITGTAP
jgi:hypothetical protein